MIRAVAVLLGLAIAACASLPPVAEQSCGNGVIDPGEDCDVPDARCVACGWTCAGDADCASLPAPRDAVAYRCGIDHACHAPSGAFAAPSTPQPFDADRFIVTDVDRDGIGDAVGLSSTAISTRLGDPAGRLAGGVSMVTPDITGLATVADVDVDGALDYIVPTGDGVVALTSLNHVVAPYALTVRPPALFDSLRLLQLFAIDDHHIGALVASQTTGVIGGLQVDVSRVPPTFGFLALCASDLNASGFDPARFQVYRTSAGASVAFAANNGAGQGVLCALSVASHSGTITNTATAAIPVPASAALIDLGVDGCPSLVIATADLGALSDYAGARNGTGDCTLAASTTALPAMINARPGAVLVGAVPLRPRPPNVEADALVTTFGIYGIGVTGGVVTGYAPYYASDRAIISVRAGDLDADGGTDAVVASSPDAGIDLLYRVASPPGFLRIRLGTDAPPANVVVDDFDGDGAADVAFTARLTVGGAPRDEMDMIYGSRDRAPAAVNVGQFYAVLAAAPTRLVASNNPSNTIADLTVIVSRPDGIAVLDELYGSPQRALIPFVDPEADHLTTFLAVVAGRFRSAANLDVVALDVPETVVAGVTARLRLLAGDGIGQIDLVMPSTSTTLANVGSCASGSTSELCLEQARLVAWPSGDRDVLVAIDPVGGHSVVIDPAQAPSGCGNATMPCHIAIAAGPLAPGSRIAVPPFIADADGDGIPDLIFGAATPAGGSIEVCQVGTALACVDLTAQLPALGGACTLAAPGRVGRDGATEIVVACGTEVYAIAHDATGYHDAWLVTLPATPRAIGLGDVTGDAVDDLLVIETTSGTPQLVVYPQLTSRASP